MEYCNSSAWVAICGSTAPSPAPFSFIDQTGAAPNGTVTSNTVALSGWSGTVTATCGPNCIGISRNGGAFTPGPVADFANGDTIAIQLTATNGVLATKQATVKVGETTSSIWTVTTGLKVIYSYTGVDQAFTVPPGYNSFTVKMWGAGGGGGAHSGASGGYVSGIVNAPSGTSFTVIVGGGGSSYLTTTYAYGGGSTTLAAWGGGGGGRSAIAFSGTDIITAGAGGGGSSTNCCARPVGAGGGLSGAGGGSYQGGGGTQVGGGAENSAAGANGAMPGTQYNGGSTNAGAGGGSGYFGGGASTDGNGGGGGGSSYISGNLGYTITSGLTTPGNSTTGSSVAPPNTADPNYQAGVGYGNVNSAGGPGLIVITCP
jgi:hypothetical protein